MLARLWSLTDSCTDLEGPGAAPPRASVTKDGIPGVFRSKFENAATGDTVARGAPFRFASVDVGGAAMEGAVLSDPNSQSVHRKTLNNRVTHKELPASATSPCARRLFPHRHMDCCVHGRAGFFSILVSAKTYDHEA